MRFDFFRRPISPDGTPDPAPGHTDENADRSVEDALLSTESDGYVSYALQLDAQMRVKGYRFGWRAVGEASTLPDASAQFRALLSCISKHLVSANGAWRLGQLVAYLDVTVDALFLNELQSLPSGNVVLCMGMEDMADADTRSMLLFLREQGFSFMLRDAKELPREP